MEKSGFFNAMKSGDTWDRVYKAENFAEYFASFIGNGVFLNPSSGLQVVETDKMQVKIKKGKAWINGFIYINTTDLLLNVDTADGVLNRKDKVVLQYNVANREIRAKIKKGEFKTDAVAPDVTRNADIYELALADIEIKAGQTKVTQANITDLRLKKELCGIVHGTIEQVDTTTIFNQFQSWYKDKKEDYDKDITTWTTEKKQAFEKWYDTNTENWEKDFLNWLGKLKLILKDDAIGSIIKLIEDNSSKIENINNDIKNIELVANKVKLDNKDFKSKNVNDALSELFTSGVNAKSKVVTALTSKKVEVTTKNNWNEISDKIKNIKLGDYSTGTILEKNKIEKEYNYKKIYEGKNIKDIVLMDNGNIVLANHSQSMDIVCIDQNGQKQWQNSGASTWIYKLKESDNTIFGYNPYRGTNIYAFSRDGDMLGQISDDWDRTTSVVISGGFVYAVLRSDGGTSIYKKLSLDLKENIYTKYFDPKIFEILLTTEGVRLLTSSREYILLTTDGTMITDDDKNIKWNDCNPSANYVYDSVTDSIFRACYSSVNNYSINNKKKWGNYLNYRITDMHVYDNIYASTENKIICINRQGKTLWDREFPSEFEIKKVCAKGDTVCFLSNDNIYLLKQKYKLK